MVMPSKSTQELVKFVLTALQAIAIFCSVPIAVATYYNNSAAERDRSEKARQAVERELQRPYFEKQLALYLEAAKVVSHLATSTSNKEQFEDRFWQLYWGELAFVESSEIAASMVSFCRTHFSDQSKCNAAGGKRLSAIELARQGSKEVRDRWQQPAQPQR